MKTQINDFVEETFDANNIEDTLDHRYEALLGLQDAWEENADRSFMKRLYQLRLSLMISALAVKITARDF
jgi:hypothetical protein